MNNSFHHRRMYINSQSVWERSIRTIRKRATRHSERYVVEPAKVIAGAIIVALYVLYWLVDCTLYYVVTSRLACPHAMVAGDAYCTRCGRRPLNMGIGEQMKALISELVSQVSKRGKR